MRMPPVPSNNSVPTVWQGLVPFCRGTVPAAKIADFTSLGRSRYPGPPIVLGTRSVAQTWRSEHVVMASTYCRGTRPGRPLLDFLLQYKRNPCRCQRTTVSGLTIISVERQSCHNLDNQFQNTRSRGHNRGRLVDLLSKASCWPELDSPPLSDTLARPMPAETTRPLSRPLSKSPPTVEIAHFISSGHLQGNGTNPYESTRTEFLLGTPCYVDFFVHSADVAEGS